MCASKMIVVALALWSVGTAMRVRKEASVLEEVAKANQHREEYQQEKQRVIPVLRGDDNPIGEGTIPGSHQLLVRIFGSGRRDQERLSVNDLRTIELNRRFPRGYRFGGRLESRPSRRPRQPNRIRDAAGGGKGGKGGAPFIRADLRNINFIICPFLSTLVNEGALPIKQRYTRRELEDATLEAGLERDIADAHVEGNFLNDPDGIQDLWNLEGVTNEHVTSTGINDCVTRFRRCDTEAEHPFQECDFSSSRNCRHPNPDVFDDFVGAVDRNRDGFITLPELERAGEVAEEAGFRIFPAEER